METNLDVEVKAVLEDNQANVRDFEERILSSNRAHNGRGYILAFINGLVAISLAVAIYVIMPLKQYMPVPITYNDAGEIDTSRRMDYRSMKGNDLFVANQLAHYAKYCVEYDSVIASSSYKSCYALSGEARQLQVVAARKEDDPNNLQHKYKDGYLRIPRLPRVSLDAPPLNKDGKTEIKPGEAGYIRQATIHFTAEEQLNGGDPRTYLATARVRYSFKSIDKASQDQILENPLGLVVDYFQISEDGAK